MKIEGTIVDGKYRILSLIDYGGMGSVYTCRDVQSGKNLAIKIMRAHLAKEVQAVERFEREIKLLSTLKHDSICSVLDSGRLPD